MAQMTFGGDPVETKKVEPKETLRKSMDDNHAAKWAYSQYCIQQKIRNLPMVTYEDYLEWKR